jgi:NAD(P)-dependent dehydrogenase (short-subunit alcohol dehydrogenase family)
MVEIDLAGHTALVTGSSGGIGAAIALRLAEAEKTITGRVRQLVAERPRPARAHTSARWDVRAGRFPARGALTMTRCDS